jgi:thiol-disulfide isomerase/thioredoxin
MIRVEVYGKPDCALCDEARAVADELQRELPFDLVEVDVTLDPAVERVYRHRVPVVFVDGRRAAEGRVPAALDLRKRIEQALRLAEGSEKGESTPIPPGALRVVKTVFAVVAFAALPAVLGVKAWDAWVASPRLAEEAFDISRADAPAPDFRHQTADGQSFSFSAHRGKVLFVNFWATWCPPCRDELPSMLALGREIEARHPGRFKMVAVSVDDDWDVVREFFGGRPPPGLTVTLDTEQLTTRAWYCVARGACPESYKFPESYIVDKSGRLVAYVVGPRNWSDPTARRFIERLIDG